MEIRQTIQLPGKSLMPGFFERAAEKLSQLVTRSQISSSLTLEQKETQLRLDGCALLYSGKEVYCFDTNSIGGTWVHIHHIANWD